MTPPSPYVGRRSRRKRLCSRGGYSREIITTLYEEISREFRWEFYLFTRLALDCWNRYIYMCMHIYFSIVVSRVVSILAIITGFIRFFFRRDTQHHAADDKREGGLYVRPAERHRCDTVRRVRESNPHEQVRTSPTGYIYILNVRIRCSFLRFPIAVPS